MNSGQAPVPIPIPRTPARPLSSAARPRLYGSGTSVHRAVDEYRSLSLTGMRGTTTSATSPPSRTTARSVTQFSGMPPQISPRSLTVLEPRVIRAETFRAADNSCVPSTSASPSRTRRASGAELKPPNAPKTPSSARGPTTPPPSLNVFPRPGYLEHSALRHLLHTDAPSTSPRTSTEIEFSVTRPRTSSPPTDSDEDSNFSPPREVPAPFFPSYPILRLPTRWSDQARHPSLSVSTDGRELSYQGQSSSGEKDAAAARTDHPIPPACGVYYYEVEIVSKGQRGHISIGFAGRDVRLSRLPGWEKHSWGYHGDDGLTFAAERNGTPYGPKFGTGDVIGCGIDFSLNRVFYTKNGTFINLVFENVGKEHDIYPSVGLRHTGEAIRVNFGHDPFKYDIEYYVQQQRNQTWAKIQSTPLDRLFANKKGTAETTQVVSEEKVKGFIDELVLSYLAHHGYAKTARAFQAQCERRRGFGKRIRPYGKPGIGSSEDQDMDMDEGTLESREDSSGPSQGEIELRTLIVNCVISGEIDTVLSETRIYYPTVLTRDDGLMLFKLRCRKFVELVLQAAELGKRMREEEEEMDEDNDGDDEDQGVVVVEGDWMDVDDESLSAPYVGTTNGYASSAAMPSRGSRKHHHHHQHHSRRLSPSPGRRRTSFALVQYENALRKALMYGQTLHSDYKGDKRPEVRSLLARTSSTVRPEDPIEAGGDAAEVAGHEARVALANELNQAILRSQGRPALPALEQLYRQTSACILELGYHRVGAAAFADMPKEFLDM